MVIKKCYLLLQYQMHMISLLPDSNEDSSCFLELVVHANVLFDDKKICLWTERAPMETNYYF